MSRLLALTALGLLALVLDQAVSLPARAGGMAAGSGVVAAGSGQALASGDYVSSAAGLDSAYEYFIEVPPGTPTLEVEIFDADIGDGPGTTEPDEIFGASDTSVRYSLYAPGSGTATASLVCSPGSCASEDDAWTNLANINSPQTGHWRLEVDHSSSQTNGDDSNGYAVRASDSSIQDVELNLYAFSFVAPGVTAPSGTQRTVQVFPYVHSGCEFDVNDFDADDAGTATGIVVTSPSTAFNQPFGNLSGDDTWGSNVVSGFNTPSDRTEYGIWTGEITVESTGSGRNWTTLYLGNDLAPSPPPSAQPEAGSQRIYLPDDSGDAPAKPFIRQEVRHASGPNPPVQGQDTSFAITIVIHNPTPFPIVFDNVQSNVPGPQVIYGTVLAQATAGTIVNEPPAGGNGPVIWDAGNLAPFSVEELLYEVEVTPAAPAQTIDVNDGASGQGFDETGTATTLGPLCNLSIQEGVPVPPLATPVPAVPAPLAILLAAALALAAFAFARSQRAGAAARG